MPIVTYSPHWEAVKDFYGKLSSLLPSRYTGLVGIRLHRTGHPLQLALMGSELPDSPLFPMVLFELENGQLALDWDALATNFRVPWVSEDDFFRYSKNVMAFYQEEDKLEPVAEEILAAEAPEEDLLKQAIIVASGDTFGVLVR